MPKTPFFLGGAYSIENFWAGDAVEGMQTRSLPAGTRVRITLAEKPTN